MASTPQEIDHALSAQLRTQAETLGVYRNKTGKGDGREDLVRDVLALRVGTMFGVVKAEIADSNGRGTSEHDAVIYDQACAACLFAVGHRRVVRAESVAMAIEIKSHIDVSAVAQTVEAIQGGLKHITRFYKPQGALRLVETISSVKNMRVSGAAESLVKTQSMLAEGLNALDGHEAIPPVVNMMFGYDGPSLETATAYMNTPFIDAICVLDKYTLVKRRLGVASTDDNLDVWGDEENALGALLCLIEGLLDKFRSTREWVRPDLMRYYNRRST